MSEPSSTSIFCVCKRQGSSETVQMSGVTQPLTLANAISIFVCFDSFPVNNFSVMSGRVFLG